MTPTRHIKIYHDSTIANEYSNMHRPRPQLQPSAIPLQPSRNSMLNQDVILDPPEMTTYPLSPSKGPNGYSPARAIYTNGLNFVPIPPPPGQAMYSDSPIKKPVALPPRPLMQPMIQPPLFTTFQSGPPVERYDKENFIAPPPPPAAAFTDNFADFPDPTYGRKPQLKRNAMDNAIINDRPFKKPRQEESPTQLPEPEDMPIIEDDGCKPSYSYAHLIGMAILRSSNRRLTLAQIYKWISDTFKFYQSQESGWQNSIRHNLSLNKAFVKVERPKDDPGKGNYWMIEAGMEMQFVRERPQRNKTVGITLSQNIISEDPIRTFQGTLKPNTWPAPVPPPASAPEPVPELPTLDSDGTIPGSDPALNDDDAAKEEMDPVESNLLQSSPPQGINSSPPILTNEAGTPDVSHFIRPSSGTVPARQRKIDLDDSGYFSSLESSAFRSKATNLLISEADLARSKKKKRGRAEDEIARIRSSSHDISPEHVRFKPRNEELMTSSPLRPANSMLPPLTPTPSMVFKKPIRPPPSVSPNTNLRQHRQKVQELVNSPVKTLGLYGEDFGYSPAFKLHESANPDAFENAFDIFADTSFATTPYASPFKKSIKRPGLNRAATSTGILGDITPLSSRLNTTSAKSLKPFKSTSNVALTGSPLKLTSSVAATGSPLKMISDTTPLLDTTQDDLFDFGSYADENIDSADGVGFDILQGFQKIGSGDILTDLTPTVKKSRPAFGRSLTSRF